MNEKSENRVVITGMGIVCPLGNDVATMWDNILNCRNETDMTTIFDASGFPTKFCAEVKNYDITKYIKNPELHKDSNRHSGFVVGAAAEACRQAKIDVETENPKDGINRRRIGIYLGAGQGSVDNENFFNAIVQGWNDASGTMDWN